MARALTHAAVRADVASRAVARPCGNVTLAPVLALAGPLAVVAVPPRGTLCGENRDNGLSAQKDEKILDKGPNSLEKPTRWIQIAISSERKLTALLGVGLCQAGTVEGLLVRLVAQSCSKARMSQPATRTHQGCATHTPHPFHEQVLRDVTRPSQTARAPASHAPVPLPRRRMPTCRNARAALRGRLVSGSQRKAQKTLINNLMAN